jgi:hypothetical protein
VEGRNQIVLRVPDTSADRAFTFDHVWGTDATQNDVFDLCDQAGILQSVLSGYNATVLAYGQTGSGKTYSMGTCCTQDIDKTDRGIAPRLIESLMDALPVRSLHFAQSVPILNSFLRWGIGRNSIFEGLLLACSVINPIECLESIRANSKSQLL